MGKLFSPLASVFLFVIGNSLIFTLLVISMNNANISVSEIGGLTSAYFAGLAIGSFNLGKIILRVGHIRAYSGFTAVIIIAYLLHGLFIIPSLWIVLRFITGFMVGGILLVIESWIIKAEENKNRGKVLALYMIIFYGGYVLGQYTLNFITIQPSHIFSIGAIMGALSIIPLAIHETQQPQIIKPKIMSWRTLFQMTKVGLLGAFSAGLLSANIFGLLSLYFLEKLKLSASETGIYMAVTISGCVLLQYPIGKLSDYFNRPLLLTLFCLIITILSLIILYAFQVHWIVLISLFLLGGLALSLYPVSISHAFDKLEDEYYMPGSQSLLLLYGIGATIGPLLASVFISFIGINGLFIYFITIVLLLAASIIYFNLTRQRIILPEQPYIPMPGGTTPMVSRIDPRSEDE